MTDRCSGINVPTLFDMTTPRSKLGPLLDLTTGRDFYTVRVDQTGRPRFQATSGAGR